jgi:hypothetical protein
MLREDVLIPSGADGPARSGFNGDLRLSGYSIAGVPPDSTQIAVQRRTYVRSAEFVCLIALREPSKHRGDTVGAPWAQQIGSG